MTAKAEEKKAALERMRRESKEQEVEGCTFKPEISARTKKLMNEKHRDVSVSGPVPAYEALFQDAERRRMRIEEFQHWFPEEYVPVQPLMYYSLLTIHPQSYVYP